MRVKASDPDTSKINIYSTFSLTPHTVFQSVVSSICTAYFIKTATSVHLVWDNSFQWLLPALMLSPKIKPSTPLLTLALSPFIVWAHWRFWKRCSWRRWKCRKSSWSARRWGTGVVACTPPSPTGRSRHGKACQPCRTACSAHALHIRSC